MKQKVKWLLIFLYPLSLLYGSIMLLRRQLYRHGILTSHKLPGRVISIGNLEVGGTGKSPVVMHLAKLLRDMGEKPAILSRGYRSGLKPDEYATLLGESVIIKPRETKNFAADEARMQAAKLVDVPVIIGARRFQAASHYLEHFPSPTVWILDDGFQHLRIERNEDWLLLDESTPRSRYHPMPVGRLREFASAMNCADRLLFTRADFSRPPGKIQKQMTQLGKKIWRVSFEIGQPKGLEVDLPIENLKGMQCGLITAIAKPKLLLKTLQNKSWNINKTLFKRDHEHFQVHELESLVKDCEIILTTEKDYYRDKEIFTLFSTKVFVIPLEIQSDAPLLP